MAHAHGVRQAARGQIFRAFLHVRIEDTILCVVLTSRHSRVGGHRCECGHFCQPASAPVRVSTRDNGRSVTFEWPGESLPIKTDQMYFPLGAGKLELAWSTMVPDGDAVYMVVLSAIDGTMLFRKNLTNEAAYNYTVYPGDNPAPLSPGAIDPALGT